MWFKRTPRNRRLDRGNVLDVKLRTKEVRAARLKLATTALGVSLGTVIGLYLCWSGGVWALDQFVFKNDAFAVRHLDIQTDGSIPVAQLRQWAGVKPGDNLLALDLARIKRDLELAPMIESVAVERLLPHTLRLRVKERAPIAQVRLPQLQPRGGVAIVSYYLDEDGHVIQPLSALAETTARNADSLPVLSGVNAVELRPGSAVGSPKLIAALRLIAAFESSPMSGLVEMKSVDVAGTEILQVTTEQGGQITFALGRLEEQLHRWRAVYDYGQKTGRAIRTLDLSVANNSPVLWLGVGTVPSALPKSNPSSSNRKKHV
jgi:cell division septal protein FtsQ